MSAIIIERLAPERQSPQTNNAAAGGACCCCCCCLHTVGGLIGAAVARPQVNISSGPEDESGLNLSGRKPYWWSLLATSLLIVMFTPVFAGGADAAAGGLFLLAMLGPGVQLLSSVFAAIAVQNSEEGGRRARLRHVGKMTWYAFLGAGVGFILMMILAEGV